MKAINFTNLKDWQLAIWLEDLAIDEEIKAEESGTFNEEAKHTEKALALKEAAFRLQRHSASDKGE